jgi:MarR family transcriptional regulator, transcriptional regulator for hemolysin
MDTLHLPETCRQTPPALREAFGWTLARLSQSFVGALNAALAEVDLSMRSFAVLATAADRAARTQLEIAPVVGLDKSTLVATIDELERRGLIERRTDPADRRARVIESTEAGRALATHAARIVEDTETELLGKFGIEEAARLKSSLAGLLLGLHKDAMQSGSCI